VTQAQRPASPGSGQLKRPQPQRSGWSALDSDSPALLTPVMESPSRGPGGGRCGVVRDIHDGDPVAARMSAGGTGRAGEHLRDAGVATGGKCPQQGDDTPILIGGVVLDMIDQLPLPHRVAHRGQRPHQARAVLAPDTSQWGTEGAVHNHDASPAGTPAPAAQAGVRCRGRPVPGSRAR